MTGINFENFKIKIIIYLNIITAVLYRHVNDEFQCWRRHVYTTRWLSFIAHWCIFAHIVYMEELCLRQILRISFHVQVYTNMLTITVPTHIRTHSLTYTHNIRTNTQTHSHKHMHMHTLTHIRICISRSFLRLCVCLLGYVCVYLCVPLIICICAFKSSSGYQWNM